MPDSASPQPGGPRDYLAGGGARYSVSGGARYSASGSPRYSASGSPPHPRDGHDRGYAANPARSGARGEAAALVLVQSALAGRPGVLAIARVLSHFGEHSMGWLAVSALGAATHPRRRRAWLLAGAGALAAHAAAVLIKRVVRRPRPNHPAVMVNVGTPSALSFPSAHATSTTAAAMLLGPLTGLPLTALVVPPMALSRLVLGVHYPSDVVSGVAIGAVVAKVVNTLGRRSR